MLKTGTGAAASPSPPPGPAERWTLAALLLLGAGLRLIGVRREFEVFGPSFDELHNFIQPVHRMWRDASLDPHVYSGYAGFFNWLIFVPVTLARESLGLEAGYVAARALVAVSGIAGIALAWRAARAGFGPAAGLLAAALLCLSRGQVREAHFISPDVLIASLGLVLCGLSLEPRSPSLRRTLLAGALLGAGCAVKYTSLLLAPALLVGTWRGGPRRLLAAGAAAAVSFALTAPYALRAVAAGGGGGLLESLRHYYGPNPGANRVLGAGEALDFQALLPALRTDLGVVALGLALLSPLGVRAWRELLAPASVVVASVLALAAANLVYPRHALPAGAAAALLAAAGFAGLLSRLPRPELRRPIGVALAALALAGPAADSLALGGRFAAASAPRVAAAWIDAQVTGPSRVATSFYGLPLDARRFELRPQLELAELPAGGACRFDLVVAREGELAEPCLELATRVASLEGLADVLVWRSTFSASQRPAPAPQAVDSSSGRSPSLDAVGAGEAGSCWRSDSGGWIELSWSAPLRLESVEVEVCGGGSGRLVLELGPGGGELERAGLRLRPGEPQLPGRPRGQVFALVPARRLTRLRLVGPQGEAWSVARLRAWLASEP